MSSEITTAFVKQYSSNVFHLSQQKGSRLAPFVRHESQKADSAFYDRIGSVAAVKKTSRHMDTPQLDTPHSRRRVTLVDYVHADLIDSADRVKMLLDPTSHYIQAAAWALGRAKDQEIIDNALGAAYGGVDGGTTVNMANANKRVAHDGSTTAGVNLNVRTLREIKDYFDAGDVDKSIPRYFACASSQIKSLLGETEVTSSDYNTIKALVQGEIDTFLGFKFIQLELLGTTAANTTFSVTDGTVGAGGGTAVSGARRCFAWAQDGLLLSTGMDIKARVSERDDKNYSTQAYVEMALGATRMEEAKVCEVLCVE